jgi:hypothetical protein
MATAASAAELKSQGAFEASRDPNSSVSADDARQKAEIESKKAGVQAFTFNPDASPEEKAAQARSVSSLPSCTTNLYVLDRVLTMGISSMYHKDSITNIKLRA